MTLEDYGYRGWQTFEIMKYAKYTIWAIIGGFSLWVLYVIAGLGSPWVSVGIVGFVGFIVLINRVTRRPVQKTGQPTPEHRVVTTDQDRWGGGASL